jgi:hypothetical protein
MLDHPLTRAWRGLALALACTPGLLACGGGDDAPAANAPRTQFQTTELQTWIRSSQNVRLREVDISGGSFDITVFNYTVAPRSVRWNIERDGLVPVKIIDDTAIVNAVLDEIETVVGRTLFDRTSLRDVPDADVRRGLFFRRGDPPLDGARPANNCGRFWTDGLPGWPIRGLGQKDQLGSFMPDLYRYIDTVRYPDLAGQYYTGHIGTVMVNSGNVNANCPDLRGLYVHETAHALGLTGHVDGFGLGLENTNVALQMLRTLYRNPLGTAFEALQ